MKRLPLSMLLLSSLYADWTSDILRKSTELYDETREKTIEIYKRTLETHPLTQEELRKRRLDEAWNELFEPLQEGTRYIDERKHAPESAWIGRDKVAVQQDINALFDRIVQGLVGSDLSEYKEDVERLKEEIANTREKIAYYRRKRIAAPEKSSLAMTKADYDRKIEALKNEIGIYENEMRMLKEKLRKNFEDIGVSLSSEQLEVLLTRVDGDDIVRIVMATDALQYITDRILQLMRESREALTQAKRYYAMHQVILELVVYIQQQYIDKCNRHYIPKIEKIILDVEGMISKTENMFAQEENATRASGYRHNLQAQEWTLRVAKRYREDLVRSRDRMLEAQKTAKANLALSRNTYETVSLSADLYDLITESQEMFSRIEKIQIPQIVPFENIRLKRKYNELTQRLR